MGDRVSTSSAATLLRSRHVFRQHPVIEEIAAANFFQQEAIASQLLSANL